MYNYFQLRWLSGYSFVSDAPGIINHTVEMLSKTVCEPFPAIEVIISKNYYYCILKSLVYLKSIARKSNYLHAFIVEKKLDSDFEPKHLVTAFSEMYGESLEEIQKTIEEIANELGSLEKNEETRKIIRKFNISQVNINKENRFFEKIRFGVRNISNSTTQTISESSDISTSRELNSNQNIDLLPQIDNKYSYLEKKDWYNLVSGKAIITWLLLLIIVLIQIYTLAKLDHISKNPNQGFNIIRPNTDILYKRLKTYLKSEKFKEADEETRRIIFLLSEKANRVWIKPESFSKISCKDIRKIDELWRKYSDNKFGFNVQEEILRESQGDIEQFGEKVGWYKNDEWIKVDELTYSLQAPKGHLPSRSPGSSELSLSSGLIIISLLDSSKSSCLLQS